MGKLLDRNEHHAVMNWARSANPHLWEIVPLARPYMIRSAAHNRAATFPEKGSHEEYARLAEHICLNLEYFESLMNW